MFAFSFRSLVLFLLLFSTSAFAQTYEGIYRPNYAFARDWSCNADDIGMDGGAVGFVNGKMIGVENQCDLLDPEIVPDRPKATKYKRDCWGEGTQYTDEIIIEKTSIGILFQVDGGDEVEWRFCDAQVEAATDPEDSTENEEAQASVWHVDTRPKAFESGNDYFFSVPGDAQYCRNQTDAAADLSQLRVQCSNGNPVVFVEIGTCDADGQSSEPVQVNYKFDGAEVSTANFGPLPDQGSPNQIGIWDVATANPFIREIAQSEDLTLAYSVRGEVSQFVMRFNVTGFAQHMDDFGKSCPGLYVSYPGDQPVEDEEGDTTAAQDPADGSGEAGEEALDLSRAERREIQRRLSLIGYNTRGVDGVFGPATRAAIKLWQIDNELTADGYLSPSSLKLLKSQSQAAYADWKASPKKRYFGSDGCLRRPNGRIIMGRTLRCDLRALQQ